MTKTKQTKTFLMNHGRLSEIVIREEGNNDMKIIKVRKKTCPLRLKRRFFATTLLFNFSHIVQNDFPFVICIRK